MKKLLLLLALPLLAISQVKTGSVGKANTYNITNNPDNTTITVNGSNQILVKDSSITSAKIATSTIKSINILDGTITASDIANSTITSAKLTGFTTKYIPYGNSSGNFSQESPFFYDATYNGFSVGSSGNDPTRRYLGTYNSVDRYMDGGGNSVFGSNCYSVGEFGIAQGSGTRQQGILGSAFGSQSLNTGNDSFVAGITAVGGRKFFIPQTAGTNYVSFSGDVTDYFPSTVDSTNTDDRFWTYPNIMIAGGTVFSAVVWAQRTVTSSSYDAGGDSTTVNYDGVSISPVFGVAASYEISRDGNGMIGLGRLANPSAYGAFVGGGYFGRAWALGAAAVASNSGKTEGDYSLIGGNLGTISSAGDYAISFGEENTVTGRSTATFGRQNSNTGNYSLVGGQSNTVSGTHSIAAGYNHTVSGNYSFAAGYQNTISGTGEFALGRLNNIAGDYTGAFGYENRITATGDYSFAFGKDAYVTKPGHLQQSYGKFADPGDATGNTVVMYGTATGASYYDLKIGGSSFLTIDSCTTVMLDILISAKEVGTDSAAAYHVYCAVTRDSAAATTRELAAETVTVIGEDVASWNVRVLGHSSGNIYIQFFGEASTTIRAVAYVRYSRVRAW